jgi:hypothetical protein
MDKNMDRLTLRRHSFLPSTVEISRSSPRARRHPAARRQGSFANDINGLGRRSRLAARAFGAGRKHLPVIKKR